MVDPGVALVLLISVLRTNCLVPVLNLFGGAGFARGSLIKNVAWISPNLSETKRIWLTFAVAPDCWPVSNMSLTTYPLNEPCASSAIEETSTFMIVEDLEYVLGIFCAVLYGFML